MAKKQPTPKRKIIAKEVPLNLPEGVVDKEMYVQYVELTNHPFLNEERFYCIDEVEDIEVDLCTASRHLKNQIAHLPLDEQTLIIQMSSERRSLIGKMSMMKKKAFGIRVGNISVEEKKKRGNDKKEHFLNIKLAEILELFGRFHSTHEVHKIVVQDWGYDVSHQMILNFRERHLMEIKELQEKFKRDMSDLRLGHKRSRLDELHYLYVDRKQRYGTTFSREDYKLLLTTLEQIRKEVEGDKMSIDITGQVDVNVEHVINLHIQKQAVKDLSILDIVIARIAAKRGINPRFIISKLHASYYSKFNGFGEEIDFNSTPLYPSDEGYDMDKIQKIYIDKPKNDMDQHKLSVQQLPENEKVVATDKRNRLLEIINKKKVELSNSETRMQEYSKYEEVKTYKPKTHKDKDKNGDK